MRGEFDSNNGTTKWFQGTFAVFYQRTCAWIEVIGCVIVSIAALSVWVCLCLLCPCLYVSGTRAWGNFFAFPAWSTWSTIWCGARSTSLWVHRNRFLATVKGWNFAWFGHVTHLDSLPKLSVRAPWRAGEMLPEQNQRVDIPTLARTAHKGPLQKRLEEYLCWIVSRVPPPPTHTHLRRSNRSRDLLIE